MDCTRKKRDKFRVCLHSAALNGNYCQTIFDSVYIDLRLKNFFSLFVDTSIHVFRAHFLFSKLFSCNFVSSWIRKAQKCISTEKERRKAKLFGACLLECVCVGVYYWCKTFVLSLRCCSFFFSSFQNIRNFCKSMQHNCLFCLFFFLFVSFADSIFLISHVITPKCFFSLHSNMQTIIICYGSFMPCYLV